jgi:mitochondrial fission protein ELM1
MVSEAAATGKPVHVLNLDGGNARFARCHEAMRAAGITRRFSGRIEGWSDPVPDDTTPAGPALQVLVLRLRKRV